jgi:hypothetical protein
MHCANQKWLDSDARDVVRVFGQVVGLRNMLRARFMKVNVYVLLPIVTVPVSVNVYPAAHDTNQRTKPQTDDHERNCKLQPRCD